MHFFKALRKYFQIWLKLIECITFDTKIVHLASVYWIRLMLSNDHMEKNEFMKYPNFLIGLKLRNAAWKIQKGNR